MDETRNKQAQGVPYQYSNMCSHIKVNTTLAILNSLSHFPRQTKNTSDLLSTDTDIRHDTDILT
jgi:hypothetical protein